jgi:hypothetical protein
VHTEHATRCFRQFCEVNLNIGSLKVPDNWNWLLDRGHGSSCTHLFPAARGELPIEERVSLAQMGAFFGAMTLRAETFPPATQWSEGEKRAMNEKWPELQRVLPPEVQFLADPEGALLGGVSPVGPSYTGHSGRAEERLVGDLREVRMSPRP